MTGDVWEPVDAEHSGADEASPPAAAPRRWRVWNAVCAVVIAAAVVGTVGAYTVGGSTPGRAAPAASGSSAAAAASSAAVAPATTPPRPTRADLCTFLTAADFAAAGVPSAPVKPWFGPGGTKPLPGQLTCDGQGIGYAMFWSTSPTYLRQLYANDRARYIRSGWIVRTMPAAGAVEAMWIARDELPLVPLVPDQQAQVWGHTDTYTFYLELPRETPDAGTKLQTLTALLIARVAQLGYAKHSPTDGMS